MEIFHNRDVPNYLEIKRYGPRWLAEFREMDANYQYAGWTLDLAAYFLEKLISNLFPEYADNQTIRMLERFMKIEYDEPDISWEERRKTVLLYWYGLGKLNRTSIIYMVRQYMDCDCDVWWNESVLMVGTENYLNEDNIPLPRFSKIAKVLKRRMPAHLGVKFRATYKRIGTVYTGTICRVAPSVVVHPYKETEYTTEKARIYSGSILSHETVLVTIKGDTSNG